MGLVARASLSTLVAILWNGLAVAADEAATIIRAKSALEEAYASDGNLQSAIAQKVLEGDFAGVVSVLEAMHPNTSMVSEEEPFPELGAGQGLSGQWNDTWFETPRDAIHGLENTFGTGLGLQEWFESREWRHFISPVGRPGSRGTKDVAIQYVTVRGNGTKGGVVYSAGRAEVIRKYDEFAYDLIVLGYSPVYIYTHRGQGESDRLIEDPYPQYVEQARDYVHDLRAFTELVAQEMAVKAEDKDKPLYLVCHSMGCGISLNYLIEEYEAQRQLRYYAAAFVTPALKPVTDPWPFFVAVALANILSFLGFGEEDAPGNTRTHAIHDLSNFAGSKGTHSFTRYKSEKDKCNQYKDVPLGVDRHPGLCLYGITTQWVNELFNMYFDTLQEFQQVASKKLELPLLMMTGNDPLGTDGLVENAEITKFCADHATDCTHVNYPGGLHWLLGAVDERRDRVIGGIDTFFTSHTEATNGSAVLPPGVLANGEGCYGDLECFSRNCDAHYGWDIFGGRCEPNPTANESVTDGASWCRGQGLAASLVVALAAVALAAW